MCSSHIVVEQNSSSKAHLAFIVWGFAQTVNASFIQNRLGENNKKKSIECLGKPKTKCFVGCIFTGNCSKFRLNVCSSSAHQ